MNRTKISYLTHSWNPLAMRCTPVSAGCTHCWHLTMADRLAGNATFSDEIRAAYAGEGPPVLIEERLAGPLRRRKPSIIGVQFMGDLFHKDVSSVFIKRDVWNVMVDCPQHTFLLLTKRSKRMLELYGNHTPWPQNIWAGITAENQAMADERIPLLLQTPAAVRFVSLEPLLGPIDLAEWLPQICPHQGHLHLNEDCEYEKPKLSWCIAGGESGPRARPMDSRWARGIRDQCQAAGVKFFMKQMSKRAPIPHDLLIREFPNGI